MKTLLPSTNRHFVIRFPQKYHILTRVTNPKATKARALSTVVDQ